jgi:hypothetical protein
VPSIATSSGSPVRCIAPGLKSIQVPWSWTKLTRRSLPAKSPSLAPDPRYSENAALSDLKPVVSMLAMLLAMISIWWLSDICRDKPTRSAFCIGKLPLPASEGRHFRDAAPPCIAEAHCGDDNMEELHRRVAAICQRYKLDMAELEGWLFLITPREFELRVAEGYMEVKTDDATINRIHDQIGDSVIDVAILDPLVKLHSVREADVGMDRVIEVFQAVADEHGCSVKIVHHTRKGAAGQGDAMQGGDDMRGSSSIQGAVRSQRMVNVMPTAEAARLQIPETDRRRYIRITNEKTNYAPPGHGGWFKLASVELANGDCVGVVEPWRHPDEGGEITPEMAALQARADDVFWRPSLASTMRGGR